MNKSICRDLLLTTDGQDLFNEILVSLLKDMAPCNPDPEYSKLCLDTSKSYGYWFLEEKRLSERYSQVHYVSAIHSYVGNLESKKQMTEFEMKIKKHSEGFRVPVTWSKKSYSKLLRSIWKIANKIKFRLDEQGDGSQGYGHGILVRNNIIYI